jgi:hypothetical protein
MEGDGKVSGTAGGGPEEPEVEEKTSPGEDPALAQATTCLRRAQAVAHKRISDITSLLVKRKATPLLGRVIK